MAISKTELETILNRIRRLEPYGFRIEYPKSGRSGWYAKIICPDNVTVQLHTTPSDRNWEKNLWGDLEKHGFAEAEREADEYDESVRQLRIKVDRQKNENRTRQVSEQAKQAAHEVALNKAAGPYVAQQPDLEWLFPATPHQFPETRRMLIPPDLAEVLVNETNKNNRPLRDFRLEYWSNIMKSGEWAYTHQGIAFDTDGYLQDGQHRLKAAYLTHTTLDTNISVGMPKENFALIDSGYARTAGDTVAVKGIANSNQMAATVRLVRAFDLYGPETKLGVRGRVPNQIIAKAQEAYGDEMIIAVRDAVTMNQRRNAPKISVSALAAAIYILRRLAGDVDDPTVAEFFRGYAEGTNLSDGDARNRLRTYLFNSKQTKTVRLRIHEVLNVFLRSWNNWILGKSVGLRIDDKMPTPVPPTVRKLHN